jgi:hypothetical protein
VSETVTPLWSQDSEVGIATEAFPPGVKQPGRETDYSPPASAEFKKIWIYTSTPPYAFRA